MKGSINTRKEKKSDNYHKQASKLTLLKKQEATRWLKELNSQSLQAALRNLDTGMEAQIRLLKRSTSL